MGDECTPWLNSRVQIPHYLSPFKYLIDCDNNQLSKSTMTMNAALLTPNNSHKTTENDTNNKGTYTMTDVAQIKKKDIREAKLKKYIKTNLA